MKQGQCVLSSLKMRHWWLRKTLAVVRCLFLGIQKGATTALPEEDSEVKQKHLNLPSSADQMALLSARENQPCCSLNEA